MKPISAAMHHSADTIRLLSLTQYNTFCLGQRFLHLAVSVAIVYIGLTVPMSALLSTVFLFVGCWMLVSSDVRAKHRAENVIQVMNGEFPQSWYEFYGDHFLLIPSGGEAQRVEYDSLIRLVKNKGYLFLYISKQSAYMVDPKTASCQEDTLMHHLRDASGLNWTTPMRLWSFSIRDLLISRRNRNG